jgi:hypothetical protein
VHSDDDSMAAPVDISVFGGYFPFATRFILDVPALFTQYGLTAEIWREAYAKAPASYLAFGGGPGTPAISTRPSRSTQLADLEGPARLHLPDGGRSCPSSAWCRCPSPTRTSEVAIQTGELDGVCWCGITEATRSAGQMS